MNIVKFDEWFYIYLAVKFFWLDILCVYLKKSKKYEQYEKWLKAKAKTLFSLFE